MKKKVIKNEIRLDCSLPQNPATKSEGDSHPSLQMIFEVARSTWQLEDERISAIDTKAGIALGLAGAFLVAILVATPPNCIDHIKALFQSKSVASWRVEQIVALSVVSLSFLSFILLFHVLRAQTYSSLGIRERITKEDFTLGIEDTGECYANIYIESAKELKEKSDKRVRLYNLSIAVLVFAMTAFVVYCFIAGS